MSEEIIGAGRFYNIKRNAYFAQKFDTRLLPDPDFAEDIVKHINDCKEHPTTGLLARQMYKTNNYPEFYKRNEKMYYNMDEVKLANKNLIDTYNKLYPKTGFVRKKLIESGSIVLNYVKPIKKNLNRCLIKFSSLMHVCF